MVIKTQVDFFEAWQYLAETPYEGEAISCIIRDFRNLINAVREINNTASIILIGMNPVTVRTPVRDDLKKDVMAMNFAVILDNYLRDLVETIYDSPYLSVVDLAKGYNICDRVESGIS